MAIFRFREGRISEAVFLAGNIADDEAFWA